MSRGFIDTNLLCEHKPVCASLHTAKETTLPGVTLSVVCREWANKARCFRPINECITDESVTLNLTYLENVLLWETGCHFRPNIQKYLKFALFKSTETLQHALDNYTKLRRLYILLVLSVICCCVIINFILISIIDIEYFVSNVYTWSTL